MCGQKTSFEEIAKLLESREFAGGFALSKDFAQKNICDYNLLEKLFKRVVKCGALANLKKIRLAILSDSATQFLQTPLKLFCALRGMDLELYTSEFAAYKRDILDENSPLYKFKPDSILMFPSSRALYFADNFSPDEIADEFASYWKILKEKIGAHLVHINFDVPTDLCGELLAHTSKDSRLAQLKEAAQKIFCRAQNFGVNILDLSLLQAKLGEKNWVDPRLWYSARQAYSLNALPTICDYISRILHANFFASKKVLITDLDNVLWGGAVSEVGIEGIALGSPSAQGEAYCDFQRYLLTLKNRGVLLCAVSKNEVSDVENVLENHPACVLKKSDFAAIKANWKAKSQNILELASQLKLSLDSFVFIDDNSAEIAEVKSRLNDIECVLMPCDVCDFIPHLNAFDFFDALRISAYDKSRTESYAQNFAREEFSEKFDTADGYLKGLEMRAQTLEISKNISRVSQLFMRTNRFNLTDSRLSESDLSTICADAENTFAKCYLLSDKFGELGIVGALIAKKSGQNSEWEITDFAMSCRALSRNLEHFMLRDFCEFAKSHGAKSVRTKFKLTQKNSAQKDFYEAFGFKKTGEIFDQQSWQADINSLTFSQIFIAKA